jgi:imidazoleglycerol phosphate dehydratase HisB
MNNLRSATVDRVTKESQVHIELHLDGTGAIDVQTGVPSRN